MEPLKVRSETIPAELSERAQWVVWKLEQRPGEKKPTKVPYNCRTGGKADTTLPSTWHSFDLALRTYADGTNGYSGIGYVFSPDDPYVGVDLDQCINPDTGELLPWGDAWLRLLDSYAEVSPSGTGAKVWVRATSPGERHRKGGIGPDRTGVVEVYDHSRFFTVTGRNLGEYPTEIQPRQGELDELYSEVFGAEEPKAPPRSPQPVEPVTLDDAELIRKACAAQNGAAFSRLWNGDTGAFDHDESRADLSLCRRLAFWTGGDAAWIDRLFRQSGLLRDKWDERRGAETYGERTIRVALKGVTEFYAPGKRWKAGSGKAAAKTETGGATGDGGRSEGRRSQATVLVDLLIESGVELFHTADEECFATVHIEERRETWKLNNHALKSWLRKLYLDEHDAVPGSQAVQDALQMLTAIALHEGEERPTFTRLAVHGDCIFLNLCDGGQVVRIAAGGWSVTRDGPVQFIRPKGMYALPVPQRGGSIELLRPFVNVTEADWPLLVAWLVAALRPTGPYPIAVLQGEQGSAKSTTSRVLRALIDPNKAPLRAEPKEARDLAIAAKNSWVLGYDNLSVLYPWLSDALCRMATGGGLSTRQLYTDDEEALFDAQRPVLLNGIGGVVNRSDLLDRALLFQLPRLCPKQVRPEATFWAEFEAVRPLILGALLDAVSMGLRELPNVRLPELPRMADFAVWSTGAETGLGWEPGTFIKAYTRNRNEASSVALEASAVGELILRLVHDQEDRVWEGTASELLAELERMAPPGARDRKDWPKGPKSMSGALERLLPNLRSAGVDREEMRREESRRPFRLRFCPPDAAPDASAVPADANEAAADANETHSPSGGAQADATDGPDTSSPLYSTAYIPGELRANDRGESGESAGLEETPEFASASSVASAVLDRAELLRLAETVGHPRVNVGPGMYVGPGLDVWERFLAGANEERRLAAEAGLRAAMLISADGSGVLHHAR